MHSGIPSAVNLGQATGRENRFDMGSWGIHRSSVSVKRESALSALMNACEQSKQVQFIQPKILPRAVIRPFGGAPLAERANIAIY
jgi:hypothetical protein